MIAAIGNQDALQFVTGYFGEGSTIQLVIVADLTVQFGQSVICKLYNPTGKMIGEGKTWVEAFLAAGVAEEEMDFRQEEPGRCEQCGRFFSWTSNFDRYTPFSGGGEPGDEPDEVYICEQCSDHDRMEIIKNGKPFSHWRSSRAEIEAAKELGFGQAALRGCGWRKWFDKSKPLPEGYEWLS